VIPEHELGHGRDDIQIYPPGFAIGNGQTINSIRNRGQCLAAHLARDFKGNDDACDSLFHGRQDGLRAGKLDDVNGNARFGGTRRRGIVITAPGTQGSFYLSGPLTYRPFAGIGLQLDGDIRTNFQ